MAGTGPISVAFSATFTNSSASTLGNGWTSEGENA